MKFKALKLLSLMLALLMLAISLVSCASDDETEDTSDTEIATSAEESETKTAVENTGLELRNFNGGTMNIWYSKGTETWKPYPLSVTTEEGTGTDIILKAGYERNKILEEQLNIYIDYTIHDSNPNDTSEKGSTTALRTLVNSGELARYDLVITGARPCGSLAQEGVFYDLLSSEYIKPDAYYYESQVNAQMKVFDKMYYSCGFFSVGNTKALDAVFVNKTILNDATNGDIQMDDLYDVALENEWTLEKMLEIGANYATPIDNLEIWTDDGKTYEGCKFSYVANSDNIRVLYFALGGTMIEYNDATAEYDVVCNDQKNIDLLTYLKSKITAQNGSYIAMTGGTLCDDAFAANTAMFLENDFSVLSTLIESGVDWALMPPPLMEAGDEYRSYSNSWVLTFAGIPASCRDLDKAGYLYEMFMAYSYDYVYPAYYEKTFQTKYQPDEKSAQVFDIIASSRTICFQDVYQIGGNTDNHRAIIQGTATGDITSITKPLSETLEANLKKFVDEVVKQ